jgi:circadian clock protein KaiC
MGAPPREKMAAPDFASRQKGIMTRVADAAVTPLVQTGVDGLDDVLHGGLQAARLYLVEGDPGSGKTTLALQFLLTGAQRGENTLLVTLSESEPEMAAVAASHGWSVEGVRVLDIVPTDETLAADARFSMYHPSEVELSETLRAVFDEAERLRPTRVVFDSLSELRLLAESPLRYRRQILQLKRYFGRLGATVLLVDDRTNEESNAHLHSIAHGVINLSRTTPDYGVLRRRLQVLKMRAHTFREGLHDFMIRRGGLQVFPRLIAAEHAGGFPPGVMPSGINGLDALLAGGLVRGTSALIMGAAGTGKSSVAASFAIRAAQRGEHATLFLFEETPTTLLTRMTAIGMDPRPLVESGRLHIRQIDPAQISPGEFVHDVRREVEEAGTRVVVVDSLNGYLNAMSAERLLLLQLHELLTFLGRRGVTTLLVLTQSGLVGDTTAPVDASYIADAVVLLRYFEAVGEVRKAISVIKQRTGEHEPTIRELRIHAGIAVGEPIREFRSVLSGVPTLHHPDAIGGAAR